MLQMWNHGYKGQIGGGKASYIPILTKVSVQRYECLKSPMTIKLPSRGSCHTGTKMEKEHKMLRLNISKRG